MSNNLKINNKKHSRGNRNIQEPKLTERLITVTSLFYLHYTNNILLNNLFLKLVRYFGTKHLILLETKKIVFSLIGSM